MVPKKSTTRKTPGSKGSTARAHKGGIKAPRTSQQYFALSAIQQETWNRVVHVLAKMRLEGISLTKASREFGIDRRVVQARAGSALRKTKSGRYVAKRSDKLLRVLVIPTPEGLQEVAVKSSAVASRLGEYSDAAQKYLRTGNSSKIKKFDDLVLLDERGNRIKLLTDLKELERLGSAGVLSFESLYARTA